jgi:short-subunit dehydrogenase
MPNAVIIGATSGIGQALAEVLLAEGYTVGAAGRTDDALAELAASAPGRVVTRHLDVSRPEEAIEQLHSLLDALGDTELIVISSGIGARNPEFTFAPEARVIAVNVIGFTAMVNAAYHYFRARGGGHLVGITSIAGLRGSRWSPSYSASKAYDSNYLEAVRNRARHDGVALAVTDILPGFVDTPMTAGQQGMFWVAPVDKTARQIYAAIRAKRRRAYITRRWALVAWIVRHLPSWVLERL